MSRTHEDIQLEYGKVCAAVGDLEYRVRMINADLEDLYQKLVDLNKEAIKFIPMEGTDATVDTEPDRQDQGSQPGDDKQGSDQGPANGGSRSPGWAPGV